MTGRRRLLALAACALVALLTAWYAGTRSPAPVAGPAPGSVRLGPDVGEPVEGYLARLPDQLPPPGTEVLALVQFGAAPTPSEAAAAVTGTPLVSVVFRVPVPRVQTALRFEALEPGTAPDAALGNARQRAQQAAAADAARLAGRPREVAATEAAALSAPDCRCVLALLVQADRAGLEAVATRSPVRAVQAAPPGVAARELALAPLLPEQTLTADPVPDDGPVPPP
jgi:hypothetical protein